MKNKATALMMVALVGLVAGCNQGYIKVSDSPYKLLNGKLAKKSYESYSLSGIASLNYLQSSAAANAQHFTNFVDGLLTHNDFGTLEFHRIHDAQNNYRFVLLLHFILHRKVLRIILIGAGLHSLYVLP